MADKPAQAAAAGLIEDAMVDDEAALLSHQAQDGEYFGTPAPLIAEPLIPQEQANVATDEVEQPVELDIPEITWETPEDLQELLDAPDFDEDEPEEYVAPQQQQYENEYEEELTPREQALQRENAKLKKQAAWAEEQKVKASRKSWEAEASKYFQFSNPSTIKANSRRAFLKQAQAQHEAVAKVAKPVFDQLAAEKEKIREQLRAEERERAAQMWGRPTAGPGANSTLQDTQQMQRERLQHGRGLVDVVKQRFRSGDMNL